MAKFYAIGTYSPESFEGFIKNPKQDRKSVVQELAKAMGGKVVDIEFLRGPYDFIVTIEADNFEDVATIKMIVEAQGAGEVIILETVDINSIARKAGTALSNYTPPSS
mgnify:CR=1 FL=1